MGLEPCYKNNLKNKTINQKINHNTLCILSLFKKSFA